MEIQSRKNSVKRCKINEIGNTECLCCSIFHRVVLKILKQGSIIVNDKNLWLELT